uniref:TFIIS N-terminal domain-containing protein n=1 Tax=Calidris pygmaea TaxID=425635 RepID=A0A8C3JA18_9CHAR
GMGREYERAFIDLPWGGWREGALDLLKSLTGYTMTIQLLQTTRIGVAVNSVRKHCSDEEVVASAKILIKNWKRLLGDDSKEERTCPPPSPVCPCRANSSKAKTETPRTPTSPTFSPSPCFLAPCYLTGDSVRDKCIEMLTAALRMDDDYKEFGVNCEKMASDIEDHILLEGWESPGSISWGDTAGLKSGGGDKDRG